VGDETDDGDAKGHEMSANRLRRIDRYTAEQLLQGASATRRVGGPLADRLVAAAAPGRPHELAGEAAALTAFRAAAHLGPVPRARRTLMIRTWLAHLLTVKAVAVLALSTAGGVALAASTGTLPNPLTGPATHGRGAVHATDRSTTAQHSPDPSRSGKGASTAPSPSPSLVGLCHAFTAGAGADHGKARNNPAFTALATAAGGEDKVDAFCTALLATAPGSAPDANPSGNGDGAHPTGKPTANPGADHHPNGPPSGHPHGPPASHPGH
jgi:hypothetical protein